MDCTMSEPSRYLDSALNPVRGETLEEQQFSEPVCQIVSGFWLHSDPAAKITGSVQSPRGRICELAIQPKAVGKWLGLHIALDEFEPLSITWIILTIRGHASRPIALRPCLRSVSNDGFVDSFFPQHVLLGPAQSDAALLFAPEFFPDLPRNAETRELILFLPSGEEINISIHELRILAQ